MKDPRLDYKTHREKTVETTESGATIETFTRFDGSVDKTVKVKGFKLVVGQVGRGRFSNASRRRLLADPSRLGHARLPECPESIH